MLWADASRIPLVPIIFSSKKFMRALWCSQPGLPILYIYIYINQYINKKYVCTSYAGIYIYIFSLSLSLSLLYFYLYRLYIGWDYTQTHTHTHTRILYIYIIYTYYRYMRKNWIPWALTWTRKKGTLFFSWMVDFMGGVSGHRCYMENNQSNGPQEWRCIRFAPKNHGCWWFRLALFIKPTTFESRVGEMNSWGEQLWGSKRPW